MRGVFCVSYFPRVFSVLYQYNWPLLVLFPWTWTLFTTFRFQIVFLSARVRCFDLIPFVHEQDDPRAKGLLAGACHFGKTWTQDPELRSEVLSKKPFGSEWDVGCRRLSPDVYKRQSRGGVDRCIHSLRIHLAQVFFRAKL